MAAGRRHKRGGHHEEEHENEERWLVSYADMMTLLFCLFMVLFAISSVNTSKFEALQHALQDAFSGRILSGGKAIMETGSETKAETPAASPPLPALSPLNSTNATQSANNPDKQLQAAKGEQEDFVKLKRRIDAIAKRDGLQGRVETTIDTRGLIVRLLTDKVFFDSGQAVIKPGAHKLLDAVAEVIRDEHEHPVIVEGHTDSQPIHSSQYPSNWELSGARAAAVVREFAHVGVLQKRMSLSGYASEVPADTNTTVAGRAHNRRVDVVLSRLHPFPTNTP